MYEYLGLLRDHVLSYNVQIGERFVHERCDVVSSLQNFRVHIAIDKGQQLIEDFLDVGDLVQIGDDERVLCEELLFLLFEAFLELILDFLLLVFQLPLEVEEAFVDVFHLLELETLQLLLDLLEQFTILIVETLCVQNHLLQVQDVLLETARHLFDLDELVAVMLIEDALHADSDRA